jgi:hypothetical protein
MLAGVATHRIKALDAFEPMLFEACFPGSFTGQAEATRRHLLTVSVSDPFGDEMYECAACAGGLHIDWGRDRITPLG